VAQSTLKNKAISLRKLGFTYTTINRRLGVPKATMSGWFKGLLLNEKAQNLLMDRRRKHLEEVRVKALKVLKSKRDDAQTDLVNKVTKEYKNLVLDKRAKELLLVTLYLGEGFKNRSILGLGNANPKIVQFYLNLLKDVYKIDNNKFRCFLHLRMDQKADDEVEYWSNELKLPKSIFRKTQFDRRTSGSKTWEGYHGVCTVCYYDAKLEKRVTFLQQYLLQLLGG